jgi:hypothetical protein
MANHHVLKPRPSIWAVLALLASCAFAITSLLFVATGYDPL